MDTGPLVASIGGFEQNSFWVRQQFETLPGPFLTCEPVLTEAAFLLSRAPRPGLSQLFTMLSRGLLEVEFSLLAEHAAIARLLHKYRDLPMSVADACLVRMAELSPGSAIFTLDAHFRIYRTLDRRILPIIMPAPEH